MTHTRQMRADVPIAIDLDVRHAHGRPSVGDAVDAPVVARHDTGPQVAITSWGARTAFGDLASTWDRLLRGDAVDDHTRVTDVDPTRRAFQLARAVALPLMHGAPDPDCAIVVGTSKGAVEDWFSPPPPISPSDNPAGGVCPSGLGNIAGELARAVGTRGPVLTLSAACASGLHALIRGAMLIRGGEVRRALVVATEASVHPLFVGSFQRLGVLAKPGAGCRPFDRRRTGFYMTEAACAVLLEARGETDGVGPLRVERFGLGGDATHLTRADPDGRVLKHLLRRVVHDRAVDLIHAHGTGTEMNDVTELAAIEWSVSAGRERQPAVVYSHKGALGHSLGASGLLSIVLNCQSHLTGIVPPNVRTDEPLPTTRVVIPREVTKRRVRRSIAVAAGFGGPTAVVSLASG